MLRAKASLPVLPRGTFFYYLKLNLKEEGVVVCSYVENQNGWHDWFYLNGMKRNALSRSGPAYYDKMRLKTCNDSRSQKTGI